MLLVEANKAIESKKTLYIVRMKVALRIDCRNYQRLYFLYYKKGLFRNQIYPYLNLKESHWSLSTRLPPSIIICVDSV